jgi:hypothetical protein
MLKGASTGGVRRLSTDKQSSRNRSTRRFSRQESLLIKSQQPNILETNENVPTTVDETDNEKISQMLEDETSAGSTDCTVM